MDAVLQRPVGLRHGLLVFVAPGSVFSRVEDNGAYGWALVLLLGLVTLIGYATVQTGLIDRDVDQATESQLAELEKTQGHLVDRAQLKDQMESVRKGAEFNKVVARLMAVVISPVQLLASFLLIAAVLYAAVALTGRKPEYHTLMGICVYSGFIIVAARALELAMMIFYRTTNVDTSLAALAAPGKPSFWLGIDPFNLWFWLLVGVGLVATNQLSRRMAIVAVFLLALVTTGARIGLAYAGA
jgi:hypothetical protein